MVDPTLCLLASLFIISVSIYLQGAVLKFFHVKQNNFQAFQKALSLLFYYQIYYLPYWYY